MQVAGWPQMLQPAHKHSQVHAVGRMARVKEKLRAERVQCFPQTIESAKNEKQNSDHESISKDPGFCQQSKL